VDNDESLKGEIFAKNSQLGNWWITMRETFELHQERKKERRSHGYKDWWNAWHRIHASHLSWLKEFTIMQKLCLHQSKLGEVGVFKVHTSLKILVLVIPFKLFVLCLYMHNSFSWALCHNMKMVHKFKP
jgi:hypothetical protein